MDFWELVQRVGFLVIIAFLGFVLGKRFKTNPQDIASLLIYILSPVTIFVSVLEAPEGDYFVYSLGAFVLCCFSATLAKYIGGWIWQDNTRNLFAFTAGTANTGYFGLPIALALLNAQGVAVVVYVILGFTLYEFTYGFYLTARGHYSIQESARKVLSLPLIYAFLLAVLLRQADIQVGAVIMSGLANFKGAYSVLGMMVIGLTLAKIQHFSVERRFLGATLFWKFLYWPALSVLLVMALHSVLTDMEKTALLLMASVPLAGNTVVMANQLNLHPEKAALAVMVSTLCALISVPVMLAVLHF